jgi:subtilase family serine protease
VNHVPYARSLAVLTLLAFGVSACGGGGGSSPVSPVAQGPSNFSTAGIPPQLQIAHWGEQLLTGASYVGPATGAQLQVNVLVHQQNAAGLAQYAQEANDPSSAEYRHWLTPQQIGQMFGASQSDYDKVAQYFASQGLGVAGWPQRMLLSVSGSQAAMQRAFSTTFGVYQLYGHDFVAPLSAPHFSTALPVDAVANLVAFNARHTYLMAPPHAGPAINNGAGYSPQNIQGAFDFTGAYANGVNGSGITIGIIGTGPLGYTALTGTGSTPGCTSAPACGQLVATGPDPDLSALKSLYGINQVATENYISVTNKGVSLGLCVTNPSGGNPCPATSPTPMPFPYSGSPGFTTPPVVTAPCTGSLPKCNPEDGEAQLDTQQAATLAPGATVDFYIAYNQSDCTGVNYPSSCPTSGANKGTPQIGISEADPEIQQAIADDAADVVSMSFGEGDSQAFSPATLATYQNNYFHLEFAALAAEGVAIFASSGDSGSAECINGATYSPQQCPGYPSGDQDVTSVGGVTAPINTLNQLTGPILAWGISTFESGYGATAGSGGGVSTFIPASLAQTNNLSPAPAMREQPDVSMIGDPSTGVTMAADTSTCSPQCDIGGTSVAAPQMAAMWALVLSACKNFDAGRGWCPANTGSGTWWRLGNASTYLYAIYSGKPISPSVYTPPAAYGYSGVFYDVLYGSNEMANPSGSLSTPIPGYPAMTGYDLVTGVGVPFAAHLVDAIADPVTPLP